MSISFFSSNHSQKESTADVVLVPKNIVGEEIGQFTQALENFEGLMKSKPQKQVVSVLSTSSGKLFGKSSSGDYDQRVQPTSQEHNLNVIVHGGDFRLASMPKSRNQKNAESIANLYENKENIRPPNKIRLISCHSANCAQQLSTLFSNTVCIGTRFTTYVNHDGKVLIGQMHDRQGHLVDAEGTRLETGSSVFAMLHQESLDKELYENQQELAHRGIVMYTYRPTEEDLAVYLNGQEITGKQRSAMLTDTDRNIYGFKTKSSAVSKLWKAMRS